MGVTEGLAREEMWGTEEGYGEGNDSYVPCPHTPLNRTIASNRAFVLQDVALSKHAGGEEEEGRGGGGGN